MLLARSRHCTREKGEVCMANVQKCSLYTFAQSRKFFWCRLSTSPTLLRTSPKARHSRPAVSHLLSYFVSVFLCRPCQINGKLVLCAATKCTRLYSCCEGHAMIFSLNYFLYILTFQESENKPALVGRHRKYAQNGPDALWCHCQKRGGAFLRKGYQKRMVCCMQSGEACPS